MKIDRLYREKKSSRQERERGDDLPTFEAHPQLFYGLSRGVKNEKKDLSWDSPKKGSLLAESEGEELIRVALQGKKRRRVPNDSRGHLPFVWGRSGRQDKESGLSEIKTFTKRKGSPCLNILGGNETHRNCVGGA